MIAYPTTYEKPRRAELATGRGCCAAFCSLRLDAKRPIVVANEFGAIWSDAQADSPIMRINAAIVRGFMRAAEAFRHMLNFDHVAPGHRIGATCLPEDFSALAIAGASSFFSVFRGSFRFRFRGGFSAEAAEFLSSFVFHDSITIPKRLSLAREKFNYFSANTQEVAGEALPPSPGSAPRISD